MGHLKKTSEILASRAHLFEKSGFERPSVESLVTFGPPWASGGSLRLAQTSTLELILVHRGSY